MDGDLSLLFDVFVVAQRTKRLLAEAMEGSPLSPEEYAVYSALAAEEPVSASDLARRLGLPVTTVHDQLRGMLDRGHVGKQRDPRDGRVQLLRLTSEGRGVHREAGVAFDRAIAPLHAALRLPPEQVHEAIEELGAACERARDALVLGAGDRVA